MSPKQEGAVRRYYKKGPRIKRCGTNLPSPVRVIVTLNLALVEALQ